MNSVRCKNLSLKYQKFTPASGKNIGIRISEFVTKTQFLCKIYVNKSSAFLVESLKTPWLWVYLTNLLKLFVALDTFILLMYCACIKEVMGTTLHNLCVYIWVCNLVLIRPQFFLLGNKLLIFQILAFCNLRLPVVFMWVGCTQVRCNFQGLIKKGLTRVTWCLKTYIWFIMWKIS